MSRTGNYNDRYDKESIYKWNLPVTKGQLMKINVFFLAIIISVVYGNFNTAKAEYSSSNSRYQILHIKQMAQRGFSNNGRTKYVYTNKKAAYGSNSLTEIGTSDLNKDSTVRELHIGVDWQNNFNIRKKISTKKITIGKVKGGGRSLKKVNVIVNSNRVVRF